MAIRKASLQGIWSVTLSDGTQYDMRIPGTLDDSNIGYSDIADPVPTVPALKQGDAQPSENDAENVPLRPSEAFDEVVLEDDGEDTGIVPDRIPEILSRYTRKHRFDGSVKIEKTITFEETPGRRLFLDIERGRQLRLFIDGAEVEHFLTPTLVTPHVFEVTGLLDGTHTLMLLSDNSFIGLPSGQILKSSMASDDNQTNWNGIIGYIRLREEAETMLSRVVVCPAEDAVSVYVEISTPVACEGPIRFSSPALLKDYEQKISIRKAYTGFVIAGLKLNENAARWDEFEGNLYDFTVSFMNSEKTVRFGIRDIGMNRVGRLTINKRVFFLRGETNRAVFPETGYAPMEEAAWEKIFKNYMAYGVNFVRFASWCPPEAAFLAADRLGLMLMPELSMRGGEAFAEEEAKIYYRAELSQIIRCYGNHPSFVMLSFGADTVSDEAESAFAAELIKTARKIDATRFYAFAANAGNVRISPDQASDFYTASAYGESLLTATAYAEDFGEGLRGHLNTEYPGTNADYDEAMARIRTKYKKPVFSSEAGQYASLPDFREIDIFSGHLLPNNTDALRKKAEEQNLISEWPKMVEAGGELKLASYREETEAVLRTKSMSGIILMGLQDYPGEGTAYVGMMDSHFIPKPYSFADPKRFAAFFRDTLPIVRLTRFTYEYGETLEAHVYFANYGKKDIRSGMKVTLASDKIVFEHSTKEKNVSQGSVTPFPLLKIPLEGERFDTETAGKYSLTVSVGGISNSYPIWIFPSVIPVCPDSVYETDTLDRKTVEVLEGGGSVFLTPPATKEAIPKSVKSEYTTDFFTNTKYIAQSGTMGQLIDASHPLFKFFPTEGFTESLWWPMTTGRAVILPRPMKTIVAKTDGGTGLRPLAELFEFRVGRGNVLFSSMGLKERMQYPEVRALLESIYRYLESYDFSPTEDLRLSDLKTILSKDEAR